MRGGGWVKQAPLCDDWRASECPGCRRVGEPTIHAVLLTRRFTDSLVYYALSLNSGNLAGGVFLNTFLMGLIEVPANLLVILFLEWPAMGRRRTASFSLLFAGGAALLSIPFLITKGW